MEQENSSPIEHIPNLLGDLERSTIIEALKMTSWVQKDAAELLGVSRRVLNYKVKIHNINHDRWRRKPQNH